MSDEPERLTCGGEPHRAMMEATANRAIRQPPPYQIGFTGPMTITQEMIDDAAIPLMDVIARLADKPTGPGEPYRPEPWGRAAGSPDDDVSDDALAALVEQARHHAWADVDNTGTEELVGSIEWLAGQVKRLRTEAEERREARHGGDDDATVYQQ